MLLGRACEALGDRDGAELELEAARQVFEALGAAPDLAALDADASGRRRAPAHGLTPRELEVLRLVAQGKTNKAIARELGVSERTDRPPREQHLHQARRLVPRRGHRVRLRARPRLSLERPDG